MTTRRRWAALSALCLGFFVLLIDGTVVSVALPAMARDLGATPAQTVWVNSAYLLALAVPLLVTGRIGDRFGRRRVYLVGLAVFTIASVGCAAAPSVGALVIWRAVQGLGAALLTPQCLAIIRELFEPPALATALAVWSGGGGAATVVGPVLGGVLVDRWGWPAVFLVNVPVGVVTAVAVLRFVPSSPRLPVRLPLAPVAALMVGVLAVVVGVQGVSGVTSTPLRAALVIAGVVAVAAVVVGQSRLGTGALVPVRLLSRRPFVAGSTGAAAAACCVASAPVPLMLYLQGSAGLSAAAASMLLLPMGILCVAAVPFVGALTGRAGPRVTALLGTSLLGISVAGAGYLMQGEGPPWALAGAFGVYGIANAFVWSPFSLSAVQEVPRAELGAASSTFNTAKQLGAVLGSAVTAAVLAVASPAAALGALALACLVAVVAGALLPASERAERPVQLRGRVVHGAGVGRGLGYPTANIELAEGSALPSDGVYLGDLTVGHEAQPRPALVSIGVNPTFAGQARTAEVHVLDFDGDLYGAEVSVTMVRRLRGQRAFADPAALVEAMRDDERRARAILGRPA
ncbi:drug resistance transporter, EmrB/QacA subfamily [Quadrisphaera granulorum]|uniref:riboflavin kinase n=1 Tax=Quadrisphaera granulorum TaxID=317664 RepID=A0A316A8T5_9ACTN|nr:MDR family MFS transporter [Quadrisphaera granulorum]PWJ53618.1 EmrB/QacA subfamily drug resistance transporter [Quadrisphaera granulorum]SZE96662.1 drug resistance transporter, EmrB/QacA subfamily [Quadrisphaera granulorum]